MVIKIFEEKNGTGLIVRCFDEGVLKKISSYTDGVIDMCRMVVHVDIDAVVNIFRAAKGRQIDMTPEARVRAERAVESYKKTLQKIEKIKSQYNPDLVRRAKETGCDDGIHFDYNYRGAYERPLSHQKIMFNMMAYCNVAALLSDPGTCKTGPYLWAIDSRIRRGQVKKAMIITLASLVDNIRPEIAVQTPELRCVELNRGSAQADKVINKKFKIAKKNQDYDIYIASYESMRGMVNFIPDDYFQMVILDEAHRIGSPDSLQTNAIVTKFRNTPYKYVASGTLISNNLMSFYMPYKFLANYTVPIANFHAFRNYYMRAVDKDKHIWKERKGARDTVARIISRVAVTFKKEDCIDIPEIINLSVKVKLSGEARRVYEDIENDMFAHIENMCDMCDISSECDRERCNNTVEINYAIATLVKLRQITSGFYKNVVVEALPNGEEERVENVITFNKNPKETALLECIKTFREEEKIIIWCCFKKSVHSLTRLISSRYGKGSVISCVGNDNAFRKAEQFKNSDARFAVFMGSKAGVGLNMQYSHIQLFYEKDHSLIKRDQQIGRQHRQGQKENVTIVDFSCIDTVDEDIDKVVNGKVQLSSDLSLLSRIAIHRRKDVSEKIRKMKFADLPQEAV